MNSNDGVLDLGWSARGPVEQGYFVFACVRNPFDRAVSGWKYLKALRSRSLEEALEDPPCRGHAYRHFTRPQWMILAKGPEEPLVVDALIRFESLQEDFGRVCDAIGKPRVRLPHLNARCRERCWRHYYSDWARRLAERLFAEDPKI